MTAPTAASRDLWKFLADIGPRVKQRSTPRFTIALSAAGGVLVWLGVVGLAFDQFQPDGNPNDGSKWPALALVLLLTGGGYALLHQHRTGPLATAGVVAGGLAVPFIGLFLTANTADGADPISGAAVWIIAIAAWAAAYLFGPGRGHLFLAGAALFGLWQLLLDLVGDGTTFQLLTLNLTAGDPSGQSAFDPNQFFGTGESVSGLGWVSILLGGVYLVVGFLLGRRQLAGLATAVLAIANLAIVYGMAALTRDPEVDVFLLGLVLLGLGLGLVRVGVGGQRRGTTWWGVTWIAFGLGLLVGEIFDGPVGAALTMVLVGGGLVAGAWWLLDRTHEPGEGDPTPSFSGAGLIRSVQTGEAVAASDPAIWQTIIGGTPWDPSAPAGSPGAATPSAPQPAGPQPGSPVVPPTRPEQPATPPTPPEPPVAPPSPGPGYWQAVDGNWYPPEQHPDYRAGQ